MPFFAGGRLDPVANRCAREATVAGLKAAAVATIAAAIPTLASVRMSRWARAYLNPAGQAFIISSAAGAAFFIVSDKTGWALARKHCFQNAQDTSFKP